MHEQTGPKERHERPLDKTWRWIRPDSAPEPAAQSGTVRAVRIMVIGGESEPDLGRPAVRHDCVPIAPSVASASANWRTLSLRDFSEVALDCTASQALAFARTQPAIDVASLGLPLPSAASPSRSVRRRWWHPSPVVAFAACVLCVLAATLL